jgi:hypothetical protein
MSMYKTFFFVPDKQAKYTIVFVSKKLLQPSLIFASKAINLFWSGATESYST